MNDFLLHSSDFEPAYMSLFRSGELFRRSRRAVRTLQQCRVCPRDCDVDRLADETALCKTGRHAIVSSHFPHFGEEGCLKGTRGSGTIFFSMCNLKCVFCQNFDISQKVDGRETPPEELALLMMDLQERGCHNINFVTPEHVVPQILEALPLALQMGLRLPLVYNTGAYDSMDSLSLMDGVVDIYMPDFKYWDAGLSGKYLKAGDYPEVARRVIREMHRQVGDLVFDENGLARRGLLVRHLVMPGAGDDARAIMRFLAELSPRIYLNIMDQYRPAGKVGNLRYPEINRRIHEDEFRSVLAAAASTGLSRFEGTIY